MEMPDLVSAPSTLQLRLYPQATDTQLWSFQPQCAAVTDLVYKLLSGCCIHIFAVTQGAAEQQRLIHSACRSVGVKLLHIARHTCKSLLLLGVTIDAYVALNLASCKQPRAAQGGLK